MPDIEDSLRRYADALERSASMPAPQPRRRRGIVLALVAAIGVVAIATTAVVITRDDNPNSNVRTFDSSSTTSPTGRHFKAKVTAEITLDKKVVARGEDVTGEVVFTNTTDHAVSLADRNSCLGKWGTAAGTGAVRPTFAVTTECAHADPLRVKQQFLDGYTVFLPGTTRRTFAARSEYGECSGSNPPPKNERRCVRGMPPLLPPGPAHLWLLGGSPHLRLPAPVGFRILEHAPSPRFCVAGQLRLTDKTPSSFSLSSSTFELQNVSHATCVLDGFVGSATLRAPNSIGPARIDYLGGIEGDAVRSLRLRPGQAASFSAVYVLSLTHPTPPITAIDFGLPDLGGPVGVLTTGPGNIEAIMVSRFVRTSTVTPQ